MTETQEFREWLNMFWGSEWEFALKWARIFNAPGDPRSIFGPLV